MVQIPSVIVKIVMPCCQSRPGL